MISPELYGYPPGLCSMIEKQPQMRLSRHAALKAATSGPSSVHMMAGLVSIDSPCRLYSGNTTRSIVGRLPRALATTSATIRAVCRARSSGVRTTGSCAWTRPITTPLGLLLRPPRPFIAREPYLVIESSPGAARTASAEFDVPIMISSVST